MQHNRAGRKLGRTTAHRRAMFRNQLASLFTHERITTTLPKAKDLRPLADKKQSLLERAKRLVTGGKGGEKAEEKPEKAAEADAVAVPEAEPGAKKPAKKAAAPKAGKAPKPAAPKGGKKGTATRTPRKTG